LIAVFLAVVIMLLTAILITIVYTVRHIDLRGIWDEMRSQQREMPKLIKAAIMEGFEDFKIHMNDRIDQHEADFHGVKRKDG